MSDFDATPRPDGAAAAGQERSFEDAVEEISLLALFNVLLRRRSLVLGVPALALVVALALTLLKGHAYTAESRFMPQSSDADASRFAGVAAQFGLSLPGQGGSESPDFYVELLKSPDLLREAVLTEYTVPLGEDRPDTLRGTLPDLLKIRGPNPEARVRAAVDAMEKHLSVSRDLKSGLVRVRTTMPWPALAVQLNRRLLDLVNDFNLRKRQSRARAEREFVEGRLEKARQELTAAEERLKEFLERNRRYESSPELRFEAERLQRVVDLRQQVYISLAQAYERSRIEEVRNTPVIVVIAAPEGSARAAGTRLVTTALLSLVVGAFVSIVLAFILEHLERERERNPEEYAELTALGRQAIRDLRPDRLAARIRAVAARAVPNRSGHS